jgi:hypothetical protein
MYFIKFKTRFKHNVFYVVKLASEAVSVEPDDGPTGPKHVALK